MPWQPGRHEPQYPCSQFSKENTKLQGFLDFAYHEKEDLRKFGLPQPEDKDEEHKRYKPKGIIWTKLDGSPLTEADEMGVTAKNGRFTYTYEGLHTTITEETDATGIIQKITGTGLKLAMADSGAGSDGGIGSESQFGESECLHLIADQFMGATRLQQSGNHQRRLQSEGDGRD